MHRNPTRCAPHSGWEGARPHWAHSCGVSEGTPGPPATPSARCRWARCCRAWKVGPENLVVPRSRYVSQNADEADCQDPPHSEPLPLREFVTHQAAQVSQPHCSALSAPRLPCQVARCVGEHSSPLRGCGCGELARLPSDIGNYPRRTAGGSSPAAAFDQEVADLRPQVLM